MALYRHLERQRWVGQVAVERLGADLHRVGRHGYSGHPRVARGVVPGLEQWRFEFHGAGLCLTHEEGSALDVDFVDGSTQWIDPWFYEAFLDSTQEPQLAEARITFDGPIRGAWRVDLEPLRQDGLIEGSHRIRLTPSGLEWASALSEAVGAFEESESEHDQIAIALLIGDPVIALEQGLRDAEVERTGDAVRHARTEVLLQRVRGEADGLCLMALAAINPGAAKKELGRIFTSQRDTAALAAALDLAGAWNTTELADGIERVLTATDGRRFWERLHAAHLIMRWFGPTVHGPRRARLAVVLANPSPILSGSSALLRALLSPRDGLGELRRCLHSDIPIAREAAAAGLVLLGVDEALQVLRDAGTREATAALLHVNDGQEQVVSWDDRRQTRRVIPLELLNSSGAMTVRAFAQLVEQWLAID